MESSKLKAAVIGLGKAGSRFDEEGRPAVWSHVGAYLASRDLYDLVGGADVYAESRAKFLARCPDLPCFDSAEDLISSLCPDVVSIATPIGIRSKVFHEVLEGNPPPRVIICEKPLASEPKVRLELVQMCAAKGVVLMVHYNRRYASIYQRMRRTIAGGDLGDLTSITVRMANRLWSIGSHAFDLLFYLSGEEPCQWSALEIPALSEKGEPAIDFVSYFPSGVAGRVLMHGPSCILLFEVDVIGTKGRLTASENGGRLDYSPFVSSSQYLGYVASGPPERLYSTAPDESTFVAIVREAGDVLVAGKDPTCSGQMALQSEAMLDQVVNWRSE